MAETNELANRGFHVDINLTDLCENYLINNISKIRMPKGINVLPLTWDTNEVDENFNVIKSYIILILEKIQKSNLKDLKYYNNDNNKDITLEANNKKVNMIFDNAAFSSDNLMKIINSIEEGIGEQTNSKTASNPIDKLPLFILLIDTNKPEEGALCKMNDIHTILGIVHEMVMDRFE
tara:strand:+ start:143 stop:676 length:534 start_codon:yes stop_codon:yes gene_type:complete